MGSRRRQFYVNVEFLAMNGGIEILNRMTAFMERVLECTDEAEAAELIDDYAARVLLQQALPGWEFGNPEAAPGEVTR